MPRDARGTAAATSWICRGTVAAPPRLRAGYSEASVPPVPAGASIPPPQNSRRRKNQAETVFVFRQTRSTPSGTPAFYGWAADPFDERAVAFTLRPAYGARALCVASFDDENRCTFLGVGKAAPACAERVAGAVADPPPAPPRKGLVGKVRRLAGFSDGD